MAEPVVLTWVGGPEDGATVAVPYDVREVTVAILDPLGWKDRETGEVVRTATIHYPVRDRRIYFYEGIRFEGK